MALTRKWLKTMGLTEEQVESIIDAHAETVDGLKGQLTEAQEKASGYDAVKTELDNLKANGGNFEKQYNDLKNEFEGYKTSIESEKTKAHKAELLGGLLTDAGITRDSVRKLINQSYNLDSLEIENGAVKDRENVLSAIKETYSDFIGQKEQQGVPTVTPPSGASNKPMTMADIKGMTPEQINANWESVSKILGTK